MKTATTIPTSEPVKEPLSRTALLAFVALVFAEITFGFEGAMIFVAIPKIGAEFKDMANVAWLMTAYLLVSAVSVAIFGRLGDSYGRSRVLLLVMAISTIGPIVSATATSLVGVIVGRGLQGVSVAVLPLALGLLREFWPASRMMLGISVITTLAAALSAVGLVLGGILVDHFHWSSIFWVSGAMSALTILAILLWIPSSPRPPNVSSQYDGIGLGLFVLGVGSIFLGLSQTRTWGISDLRFLVCIFGGGAVLAYWFRHEMRFSSPLFNVRLLLAPSFGLVCLILFFNMASKSPGAVIMSHLLQQASATGIGFDKSATFNGSIYMPTAILEIASGPIIGILLARFGGPRIVSVAGVCTVLLWLSLIAINDSLWLVVFVNMLTSMTYTFCYVSATAMLMQTSPPERTSETIGIAQVVKSLAQSVSTQVVFLMLATATVVGEDGRSHPSATSYVLAEGWCAAIAVMMTVTALVLLRNPKAAFSNT